MERSGVVDPKFSDAQPSRLAAISSNWLLAAVAVLLLLKLVFAVVTEVAADEAYYWTWSQNLALSYYDHPPLNAWLLALSQFVFGSNKFGLRVGSWLSFAGTMYIMWLFAKRLVPEAPSKAYLLSVLAFLASPTLFVWTTIVYNDHLLIFLSLAAAYCFTDYFARFNQNTETSPKLLYIGALFLGLAGLTKYNAAFMGIAIAVLILSHHKLRPLLLRQHVYLAAGLTFLVMLPVLAWNLQNEFASFQLHLSTRYGDAVLDRFHAATFARYIYSTIIYFGPILVAPMLFIFFPRRTSSDFELFGTWIARAVIATSLITFTLFSARGTVHWYWSDVSYALMILFVPLLLRWAWAYAAHFFFGLIFIAYGLFSYTVLPADYLFGAQNLEVGRMHGWNEVAEKTAFLEKNLDPDYLATTGYPTAGQLSYSLRRTDIYELINPKSHYDFVQRKSLPSGSSALILHDHFGHLDQVEPKFEKLTKVDEITIKRIGIPFFTYEFYLGEGFIPPQDQ